MLTGVGFLHLGGVKTVEIVYGNKPLMTNDQQLHIHWQCKVEPCTVTG